MHWLDLKRANSSPTWPHCRSCARPMELLESPIDFWFCPKCGKVDNPVDYSEKVAKILSQRKL